MWVACWAWGSTVAAGQDVLNTLVGDQVSGAIESIADDGTLRLADGQTLALGDLASLERSEAVAESAGGPYEVHLAGGSRLRATAAGIRNEQVTVEGRFGSLVLPLETLRAIVFQPNVATPAVAEAIANPSREFDTLIAQTDAGVQSVLGLIEMVADGKVSGEFDGQARSVSLDRVLAVVAADLDLPPANGSLAHLDCTDGSILRGRLRSLQDGQATLELASGRTLQVPWSLVHRAVFASDRLVWLAELEPLEAIEQPLVTPPLSWKRNQSVGGNRLTLTQPGLDARTVEFDRGLGVHAASRLTFAVPDGFNRFAATIGIDAETQGRGDCLMLLKADGVQVWDARVRGGEPAQTVQIDIAGVRELSLIVEPGEMLDLGDHADWAQARFLQIR